MIESSCESRRTHRTLSLSLACAHALPTSIQLSFSFALLLTKSVGKERNEERKKWKERTVFCSGSSTVLLHMQRSSRSHLSSLLHTFTHANICIEFARVRVYVYYICMMRTGNLWTPGFVGAKRKAARSIFIEFQNSVCTYPARS